MPAVERWVADLETTTDEQDCRAWLWTAAAVDDYHKTKWGTNLDTFMEWCREKSRIVYFHNLKFDGEFLINWFFQNGFEYDDRAKRAKTFYSLISDMGVFYSLDATWETGNKRKTHTTFYDSLKKLPFTVEKIAHDFKLNMEKLEIDYNKYRPVGYQPTEHEINYGLHDVQIIAQALKIQFDQGLVKMTNGSDALTWFKLSIGEERYRKLFPVLDKDIDDSLRYAYRGGWTYVKKGVEGKDIAAGLVFDKNSMYPAKMKDCLLPYGYPMYFTGEYQQDDLYPLYIQKIRCRFRIKPGFLPTIQLKKSLLFQPNEYIEDSKEEVSLVLTSVDLKLFFDHYIVEDLEFIDGYKFKGIKGIFDDYIDYWMHIKETSTGAIRTLAKLMLNSLYGKFATRPDVTGKVPYYEDGVVKYKRDEQRLRDPEYTAMGCFITAYARDDIIRNAQANIGRFLYADTDSLHLTGLEMPDLDIDPVKLGKWKHESTFTRARYLRQKTYIEEIDGKLDVKCAGMTEEIKKNVTWENFHLEFESVTGKLRPKHVKGGIVLVDTPFKIRSVRL